MGLMINVYLGILSGMGSEDAGSGDRGSAKRLAHVVAGDCRACRCPPQQPRNSPAVPPRPPCLPCMPCRGRPEP
ncbi:jg14428 [Pararge aegeria aegeria]|uniref:Jg14428 protein n=1 Tax=Pararge aegeria aegeria TaxID=348720 RepID=A0A8S4S035_9NEOP|nr:jg14428 [Pararge aegeria aegeria]